jgi:hypothetical protein
LDDADGDVNVIDEEGSKIGAREINSNCIALDSGLHCENVSNSA